MELLLEDLDDHLLDICVIPRTRTEIQRALKKTTGKTVPRTTIFDHLDKLILADKMTKFSTLVGEIGRPPVYYVTTP